MNPGGISDVNEDMKPIAAILPVALALVWPLAAQDIDDVVLPAKTDIYVVMKRSINTAVAQQGDRFHAMVEVPVTQDDRIIIPPGSYILGFVDFSERPGRVKGKAHLRLLFDTVILPDGVTRKVEAVVQSAEGQRRDPNAEDGTMQGGGSQGSETAAGAAGGAVTGGIVGAIAGRDWKGVGSGAGIGAATGALIGLFQKGKHVQLPRDTAVTIQLDSPVRFVKPQPPPEGKQLHP